jgi:hypothetical protein
MARDNMRFVLANVRIFPGLSIFGRSFLNLGSEVQVLSGTPAVRLKSRQLCVLLQTAKR